MNLELSEEDQLFRDMTRKWVDKEFPKDWCRDLERKEHEFPEEFWRKLVGYGAHGIGIPEEYGGQGGRSGDTDTGGHGIFSRNRHAALLAGFASLAHWTRQQ